jgi:hypothetical protein
MESNSLFHSSHYNSTICEDLRTIYICQALNKYRVTRSCFHLNIILVAFSAISVKGRREYFRDFDTILPIFYIPSLRSLKALTAYTFVTKAPRQLQRVYREILGRDKLPLDESLMEPRT